MAELGPKSPSIIQISHLTKYIGITKILDGLNLKVDQGEVFGFLGPNGSGKTTTIRVILNILKPSKGSVKLFGASSRVIKKSHNRIGYISSEMALDEDLSGKQYLNFINRLYGNKYDYRIKQLSTLLEVDLKKKINTYSTGNRQKICLISAMLHEPDLLILDEPTNGFDPLLKDKFVRLISDFKNDGGTVFISSHILSEVQEICTRVGFIDEGKIIGVKTLASLKGNTTKRVRIIASPDFLKGLKLKYKALPGLNLLSTKFNEANFAYNGSPKNLLQYFSAQDIKDIIIEEPDLEDVFIGLYKGKSKAN